METECWNEIENKSRWKVEPECKGATQRVDTAAGGQCTWRPASLGESKKQPSTSRQCKRSCTLVCTSPNGQIAGLRLPAFAVFLPQIRTYNDMCMSRCWWAHICRTEHCTRFFVHKTFDTNDTSAHFVQLMTEDRGLSPQSSVIKPQSSILSLRSSILNPQSSVLNPHFFVFFGTLWRIQFF